MECKECKYVTEHNGAFFCMAQKNMPYVTGNGVCKHWKPTYITNYDRIVSKTPEELADWLIGVIQRGSVIPYGETGVTLDWLKREVAE